MRGIADLFALRLACHSDALHRRLAPRARRRGRCLTRSSKHGLKPSARAACRAWRRISQLCLMTATTAARSREARTREEAPLEEAVAMLARKRMTGLEPPQGAARVVELWRPFIEEKAGAELDRLGDALLDQRAYARLVRKVLSSLGLANDADADAEELDEETEDKTPPEQPDEAEGEGEDPSTQDLMQREAADEATDDAEEGAIDTVEAPSSELEDEGEAGDAEEAAETRPRNLRLESGADPTTRPSPTASTRLSRQTNCATRKNCSACATTSTSNCRTFIRSSRDWPTDCSGGSWRSRAARGSSISKRVFSTPPACRA